jgi:hypothetical protein
LNEIKLGGSNSTSKSQDSGARDADQKCKVRNMF